MKRSCHACGDDLAHGAAVLVRATVCACCGQLFPHGVEQADPGPHAGTPGQRPLGSAADSLQMQWRQADNAAGIWILQPPEAPLAQGWHVETSPQFTPIDEPAQPGDQAAVALRGLPLYAVFGGVLLVAMGCGLCALTWIQKRADTTAIAIPAILVGMLSVLLGLVPICRTDLEADQAGADGDPDAAPLSSAVRAEHAHEQGTLQPQTAPAASKRRRGDSDKSAQTSRL